MIQNLTDLEVDFLGSLKALLVRYDVKVRKVGIGFVISNNLVNHSHEVYLSSDDIISYLDSLDK